MRRMKMGIVWKVVLAGVAAAAIGGASLGQIVVSRLTESWTVTPGGVYEGTIEIRNVGTSEIVVQVSHTDYLYYADGRVVNPPSGRTRVPTDRGSPSG